MESLTLFTDYEFVPTTNEAILALDGTIKAIGNGNADLGV